MNSSPVPTMPAAAPGSGRIARRCRADQAPRPAEQNGNDEAWSCIAGLVGEVWPPSISVQRPPRPPASTAHVQLREWPTAESAQSAAQTIQYVAFEEGADLLAGSSARLDAKAAICSTMSASECGTIFRLLPPLVHGGERRWGQQLAADALGRADHPFVFRDHRASIRDRREKNSSVSRAQPCCPRRSM